MGTVASRLIDRIRSSDLLRHGALVFSGVLVADIASYLFYVLIGRRAGIVVYGEVTSLMSALFVGGSIACVVQLIVARVAASLHSRGQDAALRRLANLVTVWTLLAGIVLIAVASLARDAAARFLNLSDSAPVVAVAVGMALFWVAYSQRGILQGAHRFGNYSTSMAIEGLAKVILGVALVGPFGTTGAVAGVAAGLLGAVAYNLMCLRPSFGARRVAFGVKRAMVLQIAAGVGLGQLTITVLTFYDVPLVKHAFDAHTAGLYAAAALAGRVVVGAVAFVPTVVLPKATARIAAGLSPTPLLLAALGLAAAIVVVALLFGALAPTFVARTIAGRAFSGAAPLVLPYLVASGALSLASVVASYNFGVHRYEFVVPMAVVALAELVVLVSWHPTIAAVVRVLAVGHTALFAATLYRINSPVRAAAVADADEFPSAEPQLIG